MSPTSSPVVASRLPCRGPFVAAARPLGVPAVAGGDARGGGDGGAAGGWLLVWVAMHFWVL